MALIKCEECKKEISDKAQQCIHCGNPVETSKECFECGNELSSNSFICDYCGYDNRTNNDPILKTTVNSKNNNFALTGMILGFSSIIAWIIPFFGFPCTIVGIVFSSKGLNSEKNHLQ